MTLSSLSNATSGTLAATGTITDDDAAPTISIANSSATEGSAITFTVSLSAASAKTVSFDWATSDGTATTANSDYTAGSGTGVTISAGSTSTTFNVNTTSDSTYESDETFTVTLSSLSNATSGTLTATGTITNDDAAAPATIITRSVGPGSTSSLAVGTSNAMTISSGTATFASALGNTIGVGDAIQYDSDNNGTVDAIAFIYSRTSSTVFVVKTKLGAAPANSASDQDWSIFRAYTSLANAMSGTENTGIAAGVRDFDSWTGGRDLVTNNEQWSVACYADADDTSAVTFSGTSWLTSSTNYIKIYTPTASTEVGVTQRHQGVWTTSGYRLVTGTGVSASIFHSVKYLYVDGLQISSSSSSANTVLIGDSYSNESVAGNSARYYSNNIARFIGTGSTSGMIGDSNNGATNNSLKTYVWNNIMYSNTNQGVGLEIRYVDTIAYNNTIYGFTEGIVNYKTSTLIKNNIVQDSSGNSYTSSGSWSASSNYNLSDDSTSTGGANDYTTREVLFVNAPARNFKLLGSDVTAKELGSDLSADASLAFAQDAAGTTRSGNWDIGALESTVTSIFRSVGPSKTTALTTGTGNNLTISSGVASFASALPNTVGVGDAVQYDSDNNGSVDAIVFIYGRFSSTSYRVRTTTGAVPSNLSTADQDWSIFRAYTSIADSTIASENTGIAAAVRNFDSWSNGRDMAANTEQWNIACYADAGDTASVDFNGTYWKSSSTSYLKVYTPVNTYEVGTTQRHQGVWSSSAYNLIVATGPFSHSVNYIKIEGLQVSYSDNSDYKPGIFGSTGGTSSEQYYSYNIVRYQGTGGWGGLIHANANDNAADIVYIWNNILYGTQQGNSGIWSGWVGTAYIYNNTIHNTNWGIMSNSAILSAYVKNNIVSNISGYNYDAYGVNNCVECDYNISTTSVGSGGANDKISQTVTFVNAGSYNLLLSTSDTSAKGAGYNLSLDSILGFKTDIKGSTRTSPWDAGASIAY